MTKNTLSSGTAGFFLYLGVFATVGCGVSKPVSSSLHYPVQTAPRHEPQMMALDLERPPSLPDLASGKTRPPNAAEFKEQLDDYGHSWLYGPGIGKTMVNVGTVIAFPPYALYLLGNAGLQLAGYQPLHVSKAIPGQAGTYVRGAYSGITSLPGRLTAFVAGEEFHADRKDVEKQQ